MLSFTQDSTFELTVDERAFSRKPEDAEIGGIRNRLKKGGAIKSLTLGDIADRIARGCTLMFAVCTEGSTSAVDIQRQQLFGIDIDQKNMFLEKLSSEGALERCRRKGGIFEPLLLYQTMSSTPEEERYRLVFASESVLEGREAIDEYANCLMALFPEADQTSADTCRMFFGSNGTVRRLWEEGC